jgi:hypothetical protein
MDQKPFDGLANSYCERKLSGSAELAPLGQILHNIQRRRRELLFTFIRTTQECMDLLLKPPAIQTHGLEVITSTIRNSSDSNNSSIADSPVPGLI